MLSSSLPFACGIAACVFRLLLSDTVVFGVDGFSPSLAVKDEIGGGRWCGRRFGSSSSSSGVFAIRRHNAGARRFVGLRLDGGEGTNEVTAGVSEGGEGVQGDLLSRASDRGGNDMVEMGQGSSSSEGNDDDDDDDEEEEEEEYEYEDIDYLTQADFEGTEWKVGTLMKGSNQQASDIDVTWVRLKVEEETKKQLTQWGDGSKGTWSFDAASQFLSMSKDSFLGIKGKDIWACEVDDYYFVRGAVRGWKPWASADVTGQWQAFRLGVDEEERGTAPWFEEEDEEEQEQEQEQEQEEENGNDDVDQ